MPKTTDYQAITSYNLTATVAASSTTSGTIDLSGCTLAGLFIPSTFDGTTITFTACDTESGTFVPVRDGAGATFTITTTTSVYEPITNLALFAGLRYVKIVCGTSQSTTSTVFTLATRPV